MISFKNIWAITKKELRAYFDGPTAYVVLAVFLFLWDFLFFREVFLVGDASLRSLFGVLPWLSIVLVPAITMATISQEKNEGTLEFLLTHPLRDLELILGKFLGATAFLASALAFALPVAASLARFGRLDWGVVLGQFLGALLLGMTLIALGILISSLFKSPVTSLLVSVVAAFFLIVAGSDLVTGGLPLTLAPVFEQLSVYTHFDSMARGVLDLRDLWYFASATAVFLMLTLLQLYKRRYGNRKAVYGRFRAGILLLVAVVILADIVGARIPGRLDLTQNRRFTLSETTRRTLTELPDVVRLDVYITGKLPSQFQSVIRDVKDLLRDYQTYGHGNIVVTYKDPTGKTEVATEAQQKGVAPIQFNVVGQEEYKRQNGYLGLAISYAGAHEAIPVIKDASDLEYQLTSGIKKLADKEKKKVVFLSGHGEAVTAATQKVLAGELGKEFEVSDLDLSQAKVTIPDDTAAVVIGGPTQKLESKAVEALKKYLENGGSALFLIDNFQASPETQMATPNANSLADFLKDYGVQVEPSLAYDLRSSETVQISDGNSITFMPYPFWLNAVAGPDGAELLGGGRGPVFPWTSPITLNDATLKEKGFSAAKLLTTTNAGGTSADSNVGITKQFSGTGLGTQLLAVSLTNDEKASNGQRSRILVIGNSRFLGDNFLKNSPANAAFTSQVVGLLAQEDSIAALRLRRAQDIKMRFDNNTQMSLVKYGNLAFAVLLPLIYGAFRLWRRRRLKMQTYSSAKV